MSPQRIQRKCTKGWRMPKGAVYVGRPGPWGNPFIVGALIRIPGWWDSPPVPYDGLLDEGEYSGFTLSPVRDKAHAAELFGPYVRFHDDAWRPELIAAELGGRDLACWCPLDQPCHADVLLEIANGAGAQAEEDAA